MGLDNFVNDIVNLVKTQDLPFLRTEKVITVDDFDIVITFQVQKKRDWDGGLIPMGVMNPNLIPKADAQMPKPKEAKPK